MWCNKPTTLPKIIETIDKVRTDLEEYATSQNAELGEIRSEQIRLDITKHALEKDRDRAIKIKGNLDKLLDTGE